jgi:RNA polymerase sigma-70 factor (ECF subfamily)
MNDVLREGWQAGQKAWPDVELTEEEFAAYARERLPDSHVVGGDGAESSPPWGDLYLACACTKGDPKALHAFDTVLFPQVAAALARVAPSVAPDEVRQVLRHKLFVAEPGRLPKIAEYAGRGALRTWLRIAATRTALDLAASAGREIPFEKDTMAFIVGAGEDPELDYLKRQYAAEFRQAFGDAFAALESRDRSLLRYAFGQGLSVDAIGSLYGVHRATAARWVVLAHEELVKVLRKTMLERLNVSREEYASILRLIESRIDVSFDRVMTSTDP